MASASDMALRAHPATARVLDHPAVLGLPDIPAARIPWTGILSFVALVLLPVGLAAWYLFAIAEDRFASRTAFSVRSNDMTAPVEIFGAVTQLDRAVVGRFCHAADALERGLPNLDGSLVCGVGHTLDTGLSCFHAPDGVCVDAAGFATGHQKDGCRGTKNQIQESLHGIAPVVLRRFAH